MLSDGETEETLKAMYAKGYLCGTTRRDRLSSIERPT